MKPDTFILLDVNVSGDILLVVPQEIQGSMSIKDEYMKQGCCMKNRKKMSRKSSRKNFSKTAQYIHPLNAHSQPMRGGFRL